MEGKELAAYILGALACVFGFVSIFVFWWLSIVGTALGVVGIILTTHERTIFSKGAFVVNVIGAILSVVLFILSLILLF